jgi:PhzF family phenazine biosynthesis protein
VSAPVVLRLAAFAAGPGGGNPAGVVVVDALPTVDEMQAMAAEVGYSETAFLAPDPSAGDPSRAWTVRYFSPEAEVPFCGHATIASAVALGRRHGAGTYELHTAAGLVPVEVALGSAGEATAAFTSVATARRILEPDLLAACLDAFGWTAADLDPTLPPDLAFAGAWHVVLPLRSRTLLAEMTYDFAALRTALEDAGLITAQVVWRERPDRFHARDPFPVGGVVEDPATGAAAAALGGYLRHHGLIEPPTDLTVVQGVDMGRPSTIGVHVPVAGGVRVSGTAIDITDTA